MMKFSILTLSLFASLVLFSQLKVVDKVVAKIGDKLILLSDLEMQKMQLVQEKVEITAETDCLVLEEIMFQNLLLNQAELDSVVVTEQQVDAELEQRIRYFESQIGGREKMEEFYGKTILQIKTEFRKIINERLVAQEMERKITEGVAVTPREVRNFFDEIPRDSLPFINARVGIQQIVIYPAISDADKTSAKNRLLEIRRKIVSGSSSFNAEAVKNSDDPGSSRQGGLIEAFKGQMVKEFDAMAFSLKPGEVSDVFETQYGFHIMKLESRRGDAYTCRHILIMPEVSEQEFDKAITKIEEANKRLRDKEITWEQAVMLYSNDKNTKSNNGRLVNPYNGAPTWDLEELGQIDRQMAQLVAGLNPGGYSAPSVYDNMAENKQGVRIVRLVERTTPHRANLEDDYQMVQTAALNKKKQTIIENWANEKIGNAYVRISPEFSTCKFNYRWIRLNP